MKRTDSLNSLKAPEDGRKKNRVKTPREHNVKFLNELYKFIESFKSIKKNQSLIIRHYKPIDLYRILCDQLDYELIYENKNIKIKKKQQFVKQSNLNELNRSQLNSNQLNNQLNSEFYDDSINLTNGPILLINEVSNEISNSQFNNNQIVLKNNLVKYSNFNQFNQTLNQTVNQTKLADSLAFKQKENEMCSYSYFLRFLKKHHFEFR